MGSDSLGLDILGLDILGLDILGLDILGRFRSDYRQILWSKSSSLASVTALWVSEIQCLCTSSGYKRWSTSPSLPLCFQPQEVWADCEATISYKQLASLLSQKWDFPSGMTLCWLRCHLSYSLLRSSIQAIRDARSSQGCAVRSPTAIDLVTVESHITENN